MRASSHLRKRQHDGAIDRERLLDHAVGYDQRWAVSFGMRLQRLQAGDGFTQPYAPTTNVIGVDAYPT